MKVGCGIHSSQITLYKEILFKLPLIELEDCLAPGFLDHFQQEIPRIQDQLEEYPGEIMISGPYIDLNPGSSERLNIEITTKRFHQAYEFAKAIHATEIVFLSSFIPIINLPALYEEDWIAKSIVFWRAYIESLDGDMTISLGNTFEFFPDYLVRIASEVDHPQFKLALDLGHCLVYSKISMNDWIEKVKRFCSTVYVHSNDGQVDTHNEPFTGLLKDTDHVKLLAANLSSDTKYLAKPGNKDYLAESIRWIEQQIYKR